MHTTTIDAAGRVHIPKAIRDRLRIAPGDTRALDFDGERIILRLNLAGSALHKELGVWVFRSGQRISVDETDRALENARSERERRAFEPPP